MDDATKKLTIPVAESPKSGLQRIEMPGTWIPGPNERLANAQGGTLHWFGSIENPFFQNVTIGSMTFPAFSGVSPDMSAMDVDDIGEGQRAATPTLPTDGVLPGQVEILSDELIERLTFEADNTFIRVAHGGPFKAFNVRTARELDFSERLATDRGVVPSNPFEARIKAERGSWSSPRLKELRFEAIAATQVERVSPADLPAACFVYLVKLPSDLLADAEGRFRAWRPPNTYYRRFDNASSPAPLRRMTTEHSEAYLSYLDRAEKKFYGDRVPKSGGLESTGAWAKLCPFPAYRQAHLRLYPEAKKK